MIAREEDAQKTDIPAEDQNTDEETVSSAPLEGELLRSTIEAILFASPDPVSRRRLQAMLREAPKGAVREALLEMEAEYLTSPRGFLLHEDGAGIRLLSKPDFAPYVARLRGESRRIRLSAAAFETLAVIAYRQPVKRAALEQIRGVSCGPVVKNLMEWNLIRITGLEESVGRPRLYGTTSEFLELFGLSDIDGLPEPERLRDQGSDRGLEILDDLLSPEDSSEESSENSTEITPNQGSEETAPSSESSGDGDLAPSAEDSGTLESENSAPNSSEEETSEDSEDWVGDEWLDNDDGSS